MDDKFLESSEFYTQKISGFSTMVIMPITLLVVIGVVSLFFINKEVVVKSPGNIEPVSNITDVQATQSGKITSDLLKNDTRVVKGQKLISYDTKELIKRQTALSEKKARLEQELELLGTLAKSIDNNQDLFTESDKYGYKLEIQKYLAERDSYLNSISLLEKKTAVNNDVIKDKQDSIKRYNGQLAEYQKIYNSAKNGGDSADNLANLQKEMDDVRNQVGTLQTEIKELQVDGNQTDIKKVQAKLTELQTAQKLGVQTRIDDKQQKLAAITKQLHEEQTSKSTYVVRTPKSGIIHLNEKLDLNSKYTEKGTTLAYIYPAIAKQKRLKVVAYYPEKDVDAIKAGMKTRVKVDKIYSKSLTLEGKVTKVAACAQVLNDEKVYRVDSIVGVDKENVGKLKFGMSATTTIVCKKIKMIVYLKNIILNKSNLS